MILNIQLKKITFIGGGNMALAMIHGLTQRIPAQSILVIEPDIDKRQSLQEKFGINVSGRISDQSIAEDVIILAVKPQIMSTVITELNNHIVPTTLVISIAAGISSLQLQNDLITQHVIRAMPNTPAQVGLGMTGLTCTSKVTDDEKMIAEYIMHTFGEVLWVNNDDGIDQVTAISGSGPAYVFYFIECLANSAIKLGFTEQEALLLAKQTVLGAATFAHQSNLPLTTLRDQVTSKGGTTAAALTVFEKNNEWSKIIENATQAALTRAKELGKGQ